MEIKKGTVDRIVVIIPGLVLNVDVSRVVDMGFLTCISAVVDYYAGYGNERKFQISNFCRN
ncbi:MAG: hypothetical protein ACT6FD_07415 [Methanosarcinaceae archaeon]